MPTREHPEFIGRYKIDRLIGKGGMGEVFRAFDPVLDRTVALKMIAPDANAPHFLERLYREAKAIGRLDHPRIVKVHDLGELDGTVFIAMEYLDGDSLNAAMAEGNLSFEDKIKILMQTLEALQYAHSKQIIHRDIKPSNVHLMRDKSIKLLDFGLARVVGSETLTVSGTVVGTVPYMSPEQLKGLRLDPRTDVFSTGVLAYELFTGRRAFAGESITGVMLKVLQEDPPPMATTWTTAFPEVERIVGRAMSKNADDRYSTAEDMRNALGAFLADNRDAIIAARVEDEVRTKRTVLEATTMKADGRVAESQQLLATFLESNPEANEVRTLLRDSQKVTAADPGDSSPDAKTVVMPESTTPPPTPTFKSSGRSTTVAEPPRTPNKFIATVVVPEPAPLPVLATPTQLSAPAPIINAGANRRPTLMLAAGAAVIVVAVAAYVVASRQPSNESEINDSRSATLTQVVPPVAAGVGATAVQQQSPAPNAPPAVANEPLPAPPPAAPPPVATTPPAPPAPPAQPPAARMPPQNAARSPDNSPAQTPPPAQPPRREPPATTPPAAPSQVVAAPGSELSQSLATRVSDLLRQQNARVQGRVTVSLEMSLRDAPFQSVSAKTADWVATARTSGGTQNFQGRVLGFAELTLRNEVVEKAAADIAAYLSMNEVR